MRPVIRRYRSADLETLRHVTIICFDGVSIDQNIEGAFGAAGPTDWRNRKARHIDADVAENPDGIFVAEVDDRVVGYLTTRLDRVALVGGIPNMAVLPDYRRRGIGKALLESALDYFKSEGMLLARIETLTQNAAGQSLYPQVGFQEVARQIHYAMPLTRK